MKRVLASLVLSLSIAAFAQDGHIKTESLTTPIDWDSYSARLFEEPDRRIVFSLTTSWISGENHRGMFRYRLFATPEKLTLAQRARDPEAESIGSTEKLVRRIHHCSIYSELLDADEFVLRKVFVPFGFGDDCDGRVSGLYANEAVHMDATEYKQLIGSRTSRRLECELGLWNMKSGDGENNPLLL